MKKNYIKYLEGVIMEREIEKIYICKKKENDSEIIEKFLKMVGNM